MESTPEQAAEGLAIVRVLSAVLDRLVSANVAAARTDPGQVTKFHAMKAPGIGIQQYLERIHKYASCSNECFILALIYIDRLIQRNNFLLTELNVHRVVITAILLAAKFFDDAYYNNAYYAKVGGVLVSEMNGLEVDFLFRINFSLHVAPDVFSKYRLQLLSQSVPPQQMVPTATITPPMPQLIHHTPFQRQVSAPATATAAQFPMPPPPSQFPVSQAVPITTSAIHNASLPQITPSPPTVDAGRMVDELLYQQQRRQQQQQQQQVADVAMSDYFTPLHHRSNSEPVNKSHLYNTAAAAAVPVNLPRCSEKSFSAPAVIATNNGEFVVVDHHHQIYQLPGGNLVHSHHHHQDHYVQSQEEQFVSGRMLTGLSSAGF